jgi:hypothetical protein
LPDKPHSGQPANVALDVSEPGLREETGLAASVGLPSATAAESLGLDDLYRDLMGDVDVCEPAITEASLDRLRLLRRCDMIRVLTQGVDDRLIPLFRGFTRELPRYLFRRYEGRPLHDRYILTPTEIVFLAPPREVADGESPALFAVPVGAAGEMIQEMRLGFNRLWGAGERLG